MAKNQGMILLAVNYSLTLMLLCSLISPSLSFDVKVHASVLDSICSDTIDPAFCLSALRSDPRTASADLPGLALISIDLAQAKAATTLTLLGSLNDGANNPMIRPIYDQCTIYYRASSDDLTKASHAVKSGSYVEVRSYAVTTMDNAESCEDEVNYPLPSLTASNTDMLKLCSILFSVARALT